MRPQPCNREVGHAFHRHAGFETSVGPLLSLNGVLVDPCDTECSKTRSKRLHDGAVEQRRVSARKTTAQRSSRTVGAAAAPLATSVATRGAASAPIHSNFLCVRLQPCLITDGPSLDASRCRLAVNLLLTAMPAKCTPAVGPATSHSRAV